MIWRSVRVAVVVGTVLVAINNGHTLLAGHVTGTVLVQSALTYAVPFFVSLYSLRTSAQRYRPGERSPCRQVLVCLTCDGKVMVESVEAGAPIPPCAHCGDLAHWGARETILSG